MTIILNHCIVPARDKTAAAKFFADLFGLKRGRAGHFAPVKVNKTLTLLFSDEDAKFETHHYAFHVTNREFDALRADQKNGTCLRQRTLEHRRRQAQ